MGRTNGDSMVRKQRRNGAGSRILTRGAAVAALPAALAAVARARRARVEPAAAGHADRAADVRPALVHLLDLRRHLRPRVRRDVLFDLQAPQVGRAQGGAVPREHDGRDRLDRDPVPDPAVHGVARHQDDPRDEGHVGAGPDDQDHRLPVEVGLRLPAGRLRLLLEPRDAARADREPRAQGRPTTCSRSTTRWSCRSTPRCA